MIIRTILFLFASLVLSINALFSLELSSQEQERIQLILSHYERGQEEVWPGYAWAKAPILLGFNTSPNLIAFGLGAKGKGWENLDGYQGIQEQKLGLDLGKMQPWLPLEGKQVFFYQMTVTDNLIEDLSIIAHERFHRYQQEVFAPIEFGQSRDHMNEENLTLSEIEDHLLHAYHKANSDDRMEKIRDLAALLQYRQSGLQVESVHWENHQMKMEGLADYVGTRQYGGRERLVAKHPLRETKASYIEDLIKWRYYLLGASLGYALDDLQVPGWKKEVERGADLTTLFFNATKLDKQEQAARLKRILQTYEYEKRRVKMGEIAKQFKQKLEGIYASYAAKPGIPLFIDRPNQAVSGGGMNKDLVHLDDGSTVGLSDRSISQTQDGKWRFRTDFISHLFQHTNGLREVKLNDHVEIAFNHDAIAVVDLLKNPGEYTFDSIKIECDEFCFESEEHPGRIVSDGKTIHIEYAD